MATNKIKSWNQKFLHIFFFGFFWEPKKTQKVAKMQLCNFATLQLFHVVVFFNCFLIKKGKKVQKLQSCKVAKLHFATFWFFLSQKNPPKKMEFQSEKFPFKEPSPYFFCGKKISQASIPRTFSLSFFVG